jgi:NADH-quinone oxidoreductase subunit H
LFAKEEFEPDTPPLFFFTGPAIAMTTALMTVLCPLGSISSFRQGYHITGNCIDDVALLYLIGVMSIGVYGIMIGGWALIINSH